MTTANQSVAAKRTRRQNPLSEPAENWARIPADVFTCGLPPSAVVLYGWLSARYGGYEQAYPKVSTLAAELSVSESTVQRALASLTAAGWLSVRLRRNATSLYKLTPSSLEAERLRQERNPQVRVGDKNDSHSRPAAKPRPGRGVRNDTSRGVKNDAHPAPAPASANGTSPQVSRGVTSDTSRGVRSDTQIELEGDNYEKNQDSYRDADSYSARRRAVRELARRCLRPSRCARLTWLFP